MSSQWSNIAAPSAWKEKEGKEGRKEGRKIGIGG